MAKKTLYHSELTKSGTFTMEVKDGPKQSKYQGKPDYFIVFLDGDERLYNVESDQCSEFLQQQIGQGSVIMFAQGSREDATIDFGNGDDLPAPTQRSSQRATSTARTQTRATSAPTAKTAAKAPEDKYDPKAGVAAVRKLTGKAANIYLLALAGADYVAKRSEKELKIKFDGDMFQACTSTLFIQISRESAMNFIPAGQFPLHPEKATAKPAEKPVDKAPEKSPEPPPEDDDIPF